MVETNAELIKQREAETCAGCRFFVRDSESHGECRRYPPVWEIRGEDGGDSQYSFAFALADAWCGEWRAQYGV